MSDPKTPTPLPDEPGTTRFLDRFADAWGQDGAGDPEEFVRRVLKGLDVPRKAEVVPVQPRRPRWLIPAAAAAGFMIIALAMAWVTHPRSGVLAFRSAGAESPDVLYRGSQIRSMDGEVIAALDNRRIVMEVAIGSEADIDGPAGVTLNSGEAWFDVVPNSGSFVVRTPDGEVRVRGTSFGVAVREDGTHVRIERGKVDVVGRGGSVPLEPGSRGVIDRKSRRAQSIAAGGAARPEWTTALMARAAREGASKYYPSGSPGKK